MQRAAITRVELARRLGLDEREVRRMLDPCHPSKGLSGHDPFVLVGAAAVLAAVVLAASYSPARRASSIAPMEALRHE